MEHSGQPTAPVAPGSQPQVVIHQQQPMAHGVQQVIVTGPVCPQCKALGTFQDDFSCCGICLAICFFPIGLLCCWMMKERKCTNCGYVVN